MRTLAPVRGRGMRRVGEANAKPTRRWVRGRKKENPLIEPRPWTGLQTIQIDGLADAHDALGDAFLAGCRERRQPVFRRIFA